MLAAASLADVIFLFMCLYVCRPFKGKATYAIELQLKCGRTPSIGTIIGYHPRISAAALAPFTKNEHHSLGSDATALGCVHLANETVSCTR